MMKMPIIKSGFAHFRYRDFTTTEYDCIRAGGHRKYKGATGRHGDWDGQRGRIGTRLDGDSADNWHKGSRCGGITREFCEEYHKTDEDQGHEYGMKICNKAEVAAETFGQSGNFHESCYRETATEQ